MIIQDVSAIVSGGVSGLGEATTRRLVAGGARVVMMDLNEEKGKAMEDELGDSVKFMKTNVASPDDVSAAIAAAEATMATTKVDFSDSSVLEAVSTAVQTKVVAAAAADETIVVDTTAFAAVLDTAVTAVSNVNAAIEAITDTNLTSTESMGTFATLTDVATEIKAAAEAEVVAGYSTEYNGSMLLMFFLAEYLHLVISAIHFIIFFIGG